jgi:hypothetical protein
LKRDTEVEAEQKKRDEGRIEEIEGPGGGGER